MTKSGFWAAAKSGPSSDKRRSGLAAPVPVAKGAELKLTNIRESHDPPTGLAAGPNGKAAADERTGGGGTKCIIGWSHPAALAKASRRNRERLVAALAFTSAMRLSSGGESRLANLRGTSYIMAH